MVGMTESQFWDSNPRLMKPYVSAHTKSMEERDTLNWFLGQYIMSAVGVVLSDKKHNVKYVEKPYLIQIREEEALKNMSEEEKMFRTKQFFASLEQMQNAFNSTNEGE